MFKMPITMLKMEKNITGQYSFDYINPKKIVHIVFGKQYIKINVQNIGYMVFGKTKHNLGELNKIGIEGENVYVV